MVVEYALIVAGGKGTRMGSNVPKQFLELKGVPILVHTLQAFLRYSGALRIILVLPASEIKTWQKVSTRYSLPAVLLQTGGDTRFQSVKRGLEKIKEEGLVAIHDGV